MASEQKQNHTKVIGILTLFLSSVYSRSGPSYLENFFKWLTMHVKYGYQYILTETKQEENYELKYTCAEFISSGSKLIS